MPFRKILAILSTQKNNLIKQNPDLKSFFVDIYHPKLKAKIPFLPIRCFRDFNLYHSTNLKPFVSFFSSGSTNSIRACHSFSKDSLNSYSTHACNEFKDFLNHHKIKDPTILSLIPQPSEWPNSSLSAMMMMFKNDGFSIIYTDKNRFLIDVKKLPENTNTIIFGTTFHHLELINHVNNQSDITEKNEIFKKLNLSIIDTGGTKGKTQTFSIEEIKNLFGTFYNPNHHSQIRSSNQKFNFFSEYGMCELGSQAWSLNSNHDGTFVANKTLKPFSINLQKYRINLNSKTGFLGFIDFVNIDSYSAIITEDIGFLISNKNRTFKLLGRAPDATIKGCSLNIKNLQFTQSPTQKIISIELKNKSIYENLNKKYWDSDSLSDLKKSFSSIKKILSKDFYSLKDKFLTQNKNLQHLEFKDKNILLISAANTPISFVYPVVLCALNDANSFTLKIPSLRPNDPLNEKIRCQMIDLYQILSNIFHKTKFYISTNKSLKNDFTHYDHVFVFGTDETLKIIKHECAEKVKFYGFGDIKNAFIVDKKLHTPQFLSQLCSVWNGRGCLTPICLFADSNTDDKFIELFFKHLTKKINKRLKKLKSITFHDHNVLYMKNQIQKSGFEGSCILRSKFVVVVNLLKFSPKTIQNMSIDFSCVGSGFVFVLPLEIKNHFKYLSFDSIFPNISHFSKSITNHKNK